MATRKYIPWVYWLAVTAVAIFGTMSADFLNKNLGMPLWASTLMLLILQSTVFIAWYVTAMPCSLAWSCAGRTGMADCPVGYAG
jgi:uncharacterized membrane-anchored protein